MTKQRVRRIIPFLILVFMFAPAADGLAATSGTSVEDIRASIARGESLMAEGEYAAAMEVFLQVLPRIKEKGAKADVYFNLARAAHFLSDTAKTEEYLHGLFVLDNTRKISDGEYPEAFGRLFEKVKAEYWFSIRADEEYKEEAEKQVIANLSRKPKKKKIPTLLIVAAGVLVAAAVVALLILPSGEQETPAEGTLVIENRTDWVLWVGIRATAHRVDPWQDWRYTLQAGSYEFTVSNGENTRGFYRTITASEPVIITVDTSFFD